MEALEKEKYFRIRNFKKNTILFENKSKNSKAIFILIQNNFCLFFLKKNIFKIMLHLLRYI